MYIRPEHRSSTWGTIPSPSRRMRLARWLQELRSGWDAAVTA
jgi:hypothetical protein